MSEVFSVLFDNLTYKERNLLNCFFLTWFLFTHLALTVVRTCQTSKVNLFTKIVSSCKLFAISAESSISDV